MDANKIVNGIFGEDDIYKEGGVNIQNPENDKIICESIILDKVGNDTDKLNTIFESVGLFGARDGILSESALMGNLQVNNVSATKTIAETSAVLAIANENACSDYELFKKAVLIVESTFENMAAKYGTDAQDRVKECELKISKNPRIMDALEKLK